MNASARAVLRSVCAIPVLAMLAACNTLPRNPVPPALTHTARIPGMPEVRAWAGQPNETLRQDYRLSLQQESPQDFPAGVDGVILYPHLALSGGGSVGAFGAGFLNGWTASGQRPVFKIVTGVSTGALMAPFAFLGADYDDELYRFYTTTDTDDVFESGSALFALMRRDSFARTAPLKALIEESVDAGLLREVARAHQQGRRLYMGTVDLDTRRFMVWNMGLIAEQGTPEALALFHKVMLASASIPIGFPPVLFEVEAEGRRYDEMHIDGFVGASVFLNVGVFNTAALNAEAARGPSRERIHVVHNGQLNAPPSPTTRSLGGIATRVIEVSGKAGIVGDLYREYAFAQLKHADFQWVTIDENVVLPNPMVFNPTEMAALYAIGYEAARHGPRWLFKPPGIQADAAP